MNVEPQGHCEHQNDAAGRTGDAGVEARCATERGHHRAEEYAACQPDVRPSVMQQEQVLAAAAGSQQSNLVDRAAEGADRTERRCPALNRMSATRLQHRVSQHGGRTKEDQTGDNPTHPG